MCRGTSRVRGCFLDVVSACRQHAPSHRITEFGGVCGLDATLKQVQFVDDSCGWIKSECS